MGGPTTSGKLRDWMGAPVGGAHCDVGAEAMPGVVGTVLLTALGTPRGITIVVGVSRLLASLTAPVSGIAEGRGTVTGVTDAATTGKRELLVAAPRLEAPLTIVDAELTTPVRTGIGDGRGTATGATELATTDKRELLVAPPALVARLTIVDAELTTPFRTVAVCGTDSVTGATELATTDKRGSLVAPPALVARLTIVDAELTTPFRTVAVCGTDSVTGAAELATTDKGELLVAAPTPVTAAPRLVTLVAPIGSATLGGAPTPCTTVAVCGTDSVTGAAELATTDKGGSCSLQHRHR